MPIMTDVRYALRTIRKTPGFAVIAILALGLGIGATTALYTLMDACLTRSLPYPGSERLVGFSFYNKNRILTGPASLPDFSDLRKQSQTVEALVALAPGAATMGLSTGPERVDGIRVTADFFRMLNVGPALGRTFQPGDDQPESERVVVISHGCWQRRFGGQADVVGKEIVLDGNKTKIVGVMGEKFRFPNPVLEFWAPLTVDLTQAKRGEMNLRLFGRLKAGGSISTAQAEMDTIAARLAAEHSQNKGYKIAVYSMGTYFASGPRAGLTVLLAACLLVLLVACANVANLMLARSLASVREIAIRRALGASRGRILSQVLAESVLISLAGGAVGILLASWGSEALMAVIPPVLHPMADVGLNGPVLLFAMVLSLLSGVVFGIVPAWQVSRTDPNDSLKEGGRSNTGSRSKGRLRAALVVAEVALCATLLVGAGILMRTLADMQTANMGFDTNHVLTVQLTLPSGRYGTPEQRRAFVQSAVDRMRAINGVEAAGLTTALPLASGQPSTNFSIEGVSTSDEERIYVRHSAVTTGYLEAMRIPILRGRGILESDDAGAQRVAIINETMARRYWPAGDPIGKRFKLGGLSSNTPWITIAGVAGDVKQNGLDSEVLPAAYMPYAQDSQGYLFGVMRAVKGTDATTLARPAQQAVAALDANLALAQIRTMSQVVSDAAQIGRTILKLLVFLAIVALVLAVGGIYGVVSYSVNQRTHEMGVRMAMGASRSNVVSMVVRQAVTLSGVGLVLGAAGAVPFTKLLRSVVAGATSVEPLVVLGVAVLLVLATVLGSMLPARRAASLNPMEALRCE